MAKNSQPSLVAGLALDTANLYREAASSANNAPFSAPGNKAAQYAAYKAAAFQAYALCFTGQSPKSFRQERSPALCMET